MARSWTLPSLPRRVRPGSPCGRRSEPRCREDLTRSVVDGSGRPGRSADASRIRWKGFLRARAPSGRRGSPLLRRGWADRRGSCGGPRVPTRGVKDRGCRRPIRADRDPNGAGDARVPMPFPVRRVLPAGGPPRASLGADCGSRGRGRPGTCFSVKPMHWPCRVLCARLPGRPPVPSRRARYRRRRVSRRSAGSRSCGSALPCGLCGKREDGEVLRDPIAKAIAKACARR